MREAGDILGVTDKIKNRSEPKAILKFILDQIVSEELCRSILRKIMRSNAIIQLIFYIL